jgi:hypothetical protein
MLVLYRQLNAAARPGVLHVWHTHKYWQQNGITAHGAGTAACHWPICCGAQPACGAHEFSPAPARVRCAV